MSNRYANYYRDSLYTNYEGNDEGNYEGNYEGYTNYRYNAEYDTISMNSSIYSSIYSKYETDIIDYYFEEKPVEKNYNNGTFNDIVVRQQGTFNDDVVRQQGTFNDEDNQNSYLLELPLSNSQYNRLKKSWNQQMDNELKEQEIKHFPLPKNEQHFSLPVTEKQYRYLKESWDQTDYKGLKNKLNDQNHITLYNDDNDIIRRQTSMPLKKKSKSSWFSFKTKK
jgi:hypothetical protein